MKHLFLVRHSIAENIEKNHKDFARSLTQEGIDRINNVVKKIPSEFSKNAFFITSSAKRSIQTCKLFAQYFQIPPQKIKEESFLYSCFREQSFFYFLEEIASKEENVWIFGHNLILSNLTEELLNKKFYSLPKCAVVYFKSNASNWIEMNYENTHLELFINPKEK